MSLNKNLLALLAIAVLLQAASFAAPSPAEVSDNVSEAETGEAVVFSDNYVEIDIGEKSAQSNLRFAEIDGVQTAIAEDNNKYSFEIGDEDVLVEIVEKTSADTSVVVGAQYFYVDAVNKSVKRLDMNDFMQAYDEKSIRTAGNKGIRFKAHILSQAKREQEKFVIDEYGFIVSTEQALGSEELTLSSSSYIRGVGYNRADGIDVVFDGTNDDFDVFTLVLKNIPVRNYKTPIVCKTYTRLVVNGKPYVVYGETMRGSVYDIAADILGDDYTNLGTAEIIREYVAYSGTNKVSFTNASVSSQFGENEVTVSGSFTNTDSVGKTYNAYAFVFNKFGEAVGIKKSQDFIIASGENSFSATFSLEEGEQQTETIVLTSDADPICKENVICWYPTDTAFYTKLASSSYKSDTDFSDYFNPDINVSYIEALTLVSNLHAKYNNTVIEKDEDAVYEHIVELDDPELLVDLSERNSVNLTGINFGHATGYIDEENGYLVGTSTKKSNGGYDPQVTINGLSLDSRKYNKITIRMKYESVEGGTTNFRGQTLQVFFKTNFNSTIDEAKSVRYTIPSSSMAKDWFEVELEVGAFTSFQYWKDVITGIRIDPLNGNAKFYIDYVKFTQSDRYHSENWYDVYLDYGIENDFINIEKVASEDFDRDITREEFLLMLLKCFPEEVFAAINEINGIPDIGKNDKNADLYVLLYRSGITLGFDGEGNLGLEELLKRSEFASIANRLLVSRNRLKGTVEASWDAEEYQHDIEFNSETDIDLFSNKTRMTDITVADGHLSFTAGYDSYMVRENLSIDASKYSKLRVRIKAEYDTEPTGDGEISTEIYFKPNDYNGNIADYHSSMKVTEIYKDQHGWYVFEIDLSSNPKWKGTINYFRFDPMNGAGKYVIDYIRFVKNPYADLPTQADLIAAGYTATKLMPDGFRNGFFVTKVDQSQTSAELLERTFIFPESTETPMWVIGPFWQGANAEERYDLYDNRDTTLGAYTLADKKGINKIVYNPEEDSITQTFNCSKIYEGEPHIESEYDWWPHQLLDTTSEFTNSVNQETHSANADRMFIELDIKLHSFEDKDTANISTTEHPYRKVCDYLAYFYLRPKRTPNQRIWFGLNLFSGRSLSAPTTTATGWAPDSAAHQFMYGMRQATVYGGIENSLNPVKGEVVLNEWRHIRLDVTPHIDKAVEWANRDNIFGYEVTKEDMFFNGVNIGFESAGNYDCTIEIKNFNLIAYNAPEESE